MSIISLILPFCCFLFNTSSSDCSQVPAINKEIIAFVKSNIKKKVGRGECWDLAAEALDKAGAKWDHNFKFGREVNPGSGDCIFPGDIIQFEGVVVEYREGNTFFRETLAHHTAVIFEVKEKSDFMIAQQNTSSHGKKVSVDPLDLNNIKKGKVTIYRPEK